MKTFFLLNLLFLSFYYSTQAQLSIDSIQEIILFDHVNYNYERSRSKEYKIILDHTKNKALWYDTRSISRSEFMDTKRKAMSQKYNRLSIKWNDKYNKTRDTIYRNKKREYGEWFWAKSKVDYDKYMKKIEGKKFARKKIDRSLLDNLVAALNEPAMDFETYAYDEFLPMATWFEEHREDLKDYVRKSKDIYFKHKDSMILKIDTFDFSIFEKGETDSVMNDREKMGYNHNESLKQDESFIRDTIYEGDTVEYQKYIASLSIEVDFDNLYLTKNENLVLGILRPFITSYYPELSISLITQNQDTIYYYNASKNDPPLDWELCIDEDNEVEYWNININKAFYALLPKCPKLNRWRLNEPKFSPIFRWFLSEHL
ncbi:MAG: hypothetical protein MK212_16615 [Saprospiraceae bacterium]|nr:hypothetical protein [Saprospiraceae bacterium]